MGNICRFGRPGRNGSRTGHHQKQGAGRLLQIRLGAVTQNTVKNRLLLSGQISGQLCKMHELSVYILNRWN